MSSLQEALEQKGFKQSDVADFPQKEIKSKVKKTEDKVITESNKEIWK